jgi:hypothetical protein
LTISSHSASSEASPAPSLYFIFFTTLCIIWNYFAYGFHYTSLMLKRKFYRGRGTLLFCSFLSWGLE